MIDLIVKKDCDYYSGTLQWGAKHEVVMDAMNNLGELVL